MDLVKANSIICLQKSLVSKRSLGMKSCVVLYAVSRSSFRFQVCKDTIYGDYDALTEPVHISWSSMGFDLTNIVYVRLR